MGFRYYEPKDRLDTPRFISDGINNECGSCEVNCLINLNKESDVTFFLRQQSKGLSDSQCRNVKSL